MPKKGTRAKTKSLVIKAQRDIFTDKAVGQLLLYDETREFVLLEDMRRDTRTLFKHKEFKIYLHATLTPHGRLILGERASPQDW